MHNFAAIFNKLVDFPFGYVNSINYGSKNVDCSSCMTYSYCNEWVK